MQRIAELLLLVVWAAMSLLALESAALAVYPDPWPGRSTGSGADAPLLGGLAALGFWWFWRRWRDRHE